MAVIAAGIITLSFERDILANYRYYKLQSSTATPPTKPTSIATLPPSGWTDTEPTYTEGSTNTLYMVDLTTYSDGTFYYTPVLKSSSYEAAKSAYNKAVIAQNAADDTLTKATAKYGTCSTAAGTAAKVIACEGFELFDGAEITIKFTTASTANVPTLNVNGTGAKGILLNNAAPSNSNELKWGANTYIKFVYNGSNWVPIGHVRSYRVTCSTAAGTAAKTASISDFVRCPGTKITVIFTAGNTSSSMTLNISSSGSGNVYVNNELSVSNKLIFPANTTANFTMAASGDWVFESSDNLLNEIEWNESDGLTIRAQSESNSRVQITNDAVNIYDVDGNLGTRTDYSGMSVYKNNTRIARFGDTTVIGNSEANRIVITDDSFTLIDNNNDTSFILWNDAESSSVMSIAESSGDILPDRGNFRYTLAGTPGNSATIYTDLRLTLINDETRRFTGQFEQGEAKAIGYSETVDPIDGTSYDSLISYNGDRSFVFSMMKDSHIKQMTCMFTYFGTYTKYKVAMALGLSSDEDLYSKITALGWASEVIE